MKVKRNYMKYYNEEKIGERWVIRRVFSEIRDKFKEAS